MAILGAVESLRRPKITGWAIDTDTDGPATVECYIDDVRIRKLRTDIVRQGFEELVPSGKVGFQFRIDKNLLPYIATPESLSFRVNGKRLPITRNRLKALPEASRKPLSRLSELLGKGYIVSKKGKLKLSIHLDDAWQKKAFDFYAEAREKFRSLFGYDLYIAYGTLLGAVREKNFIAGDDDFDTAYLSKHEKADDVKKEMVHIIKTLIASGERIRVGQRRNLFHWRGRNKVELDIFPSWLRGENYYLSFAVGSPAAEAVRAGFESRQFRDRDVLMPVRAEDVLTATYGQWREPDPLFQWVVSPPVAREMRKVTLSKAELAEIYWDATYGKLKSVAPPSPFAEEVAAKWIDDRFKAVIEVGCGSGRDTAHVAGGRPALGLDYSEAVVAKNRSERGTETLGFAVADVRDAQALDQVTRDFIAKAGGPIALYCRFFIHSITDDGEASLRTLFEKLPAGSRMLFEFRTHLDANLEKTFGDHYRRFVNPDHFIERVTKSGKFRLVHGERGHGYAVWGDEDPHVARLIFDC